MFFDRFREVYRKGPTLKELTELYLKYADLKSITQKAHGYHAQHFLRMLGNRKASGIRVQDMAAFAESQKARGLAATTIRLRVMIFKAVLHWGQRTGRLKSNPGEMFTMPKIKTRRTAPPSPEELKQMLAYAVPHLQRVIILGYHLGARIGPSELFRLKWQNVDFEQRIVHMPNAAKASGDDFRPVPVRDDLLSKLMEWHVADGICPWVINYKGKPVQSVGYAWHDARVKASIERRIVPYSLRHAFPSYALDHGADLGAVCAIMGHTSSRMVIEVYQHVQTKQLRMAVDAVPCLQFDML